MISQTLCERSVRDGSRRTHVWLRTDTIKKLDRVAKNSYYSRNKLIQIAADRLLEELELQQEDTNDNEKK